MRFEVAQMLRLNLAPLRCRSLCFRLVHVHVETSSPSPCWRFWFSRSVIPGHVYDSEALGALASLSTPPLRVVRVFSRRPASRSIRGSAALRVLRQAVFRMFGTGGLHPPRSPVAGAP